MKRIFYFSMVFLMVAAMLPAVASAEPPPPEKPGRPEKSQPVQANSSTGERLLSTSGALSTTNPNVLLVASDDDTYFWGDPSWSQVSGGSSLTISPHGGSVYMAKFNSFNYTGSARMATGPLDLGGTIAPVVDFWMSHDAQWYNMHDNLQIQVSTDGTNWTNVGVPLQRVDPSCTTACWQQHTFPLPAGYNVNPVYIGFLGDSGYGNNIFIDDFTIIEDITIMNGGEPIVSEGFEYSFLPDGWSQTSVPWAGGPMERALKAYGDLGAIDRFDAANDTPTLAELYPYDVVLVWAEYPYFESTALGDVLADYVDTGGKVINLSYSMDAKEGFYLGGRFKSGYYSAMWGATSYTSGTICLGTVFDSLHPVMQGITEICDSGQHVELNLAPTNGSTALAAWGNNALLVAVKDDRSVVSINGYPGIWYEWTGQLDNLVHNAILWLAGGISNRVPYAPDSTAVVTGWNGGTFALPALDAEGGSLSITSVVQADPDSQGVVSGRVAYCYGPLDCYAEFDYTPPATHPDEMYFDFTYRVNDGTSESNTATVTLGVGDIPFAEGGTWLASNNSQTTIVLKGYDGLSSSLTFSIIDPPQHGTLGTPDQSLCEQVTDDPMTFYACISRVLYTADVGYSGEDHFDFYVHDGYLPSLPATVTLWVAPNSASTAQSATLTISSKIPSTIFLEATDPDVVSPWGYPLQDPMTFHISSDPINGTLGTPSEAVCSVIFDGTYYSQCRSTVTYTPPSDPSLSSDSFSFYVNDSHSDSSSATVNLTLQPVVTLVVNTTDDNYDGACTPTHCSLREAVLYSASGDRIEFDLPEGSTITLGKQILLNKDLTIKGPGADLLTISGNGSSRVFEIFNTSVNINVSISGLTIRDGYSYEGGGIYIHGMYSHATLDDCVIGPDNVVTNAGGGISVSGRASLLLNRSSVINNQGTGAIGGAGIYVNYATIKLVNSTVSGNVTNNFGGGIMVVYRGSAQLIHSTITANTANENYLSESWGGGGGIYIKDEDADTGSATLQNSIVAGNIDKTAPATHDKWPDVFGDFTSFGGNLIGDDTGSSGWDVEYDMVGTAVDPIDPLLDPLNLNEPGSTPTHALLEDSQAIDAVGCAAGVGIDQRGVVRPQGWLCDIGAYEFEQAIPDQGYLKISKVFDPLTSLFTDDFAVVYNCGGGDQTVNLAAGESTIVGPFNTGTSCTVTEPTLPTAPTDWIFSTPGITGSPATIVKGGQTNPVEATVTNSISHDQGYLKISKVFDPLASGFTGDFAVVYNCGGGDQTVDLAAGESTTVGPFDTGTSCTVTELTLPTAPTDWTFGAPGITGSPATVVKGDQTTAVTVTVSNSISRDQGYLKISKVFDPLTSGFTGSFSVEYDCGGGKQTVSLAAGASTTVGPFDTGTSCTVTEPTLPTALAGWTFGTPSISGSPAIIVKGGQTTPVEVTVTNSISRDQGYLKISKVFNPLTSGFTGDFAIVYNCDVGDQTVYLAAGESTTVGPFDTGTSCTVTEPTLPTAPTDWTFGAPGITGSPATVVKGDQTTAVTVTVSNSIGRPHMWVSNIDLTSKAGRTTFTLTGLVTIIDESGPLSKAVVTIEWKNGGSVIGPHSAPTASTNRSGIAKFTLRSQSAGTYELCVTNVAKTGWDYNETQNAESCQPITVPVTTPTGILPTRLDFRR